jgi:hypothetical protein
VCVVCVVCVVCALCRVPCGRLPKKRKGTGKPRVRPPSLDAVTGTSPASTPFSTGTVLKRTSGEPRVRACTRVRANQGKSAQGRGRVPDDGAAGVEFVVGGGDGAERDAEVGRRHKVEAEHGHLEVARRGALRWQQRRDDRRCIARHNMTPQRAHTREHDAQHAARDTQHTPYRGQRRKRCGRARPARWVRPPA